AAPGLFYLCLCLFNMPIGTPFHPRTSALCVSHNWRVWSGYLAASTYEVVHDHEYHAIRDSAALIDISPLFKYEVSGRDALKLVNQVATRDGGACAVGQAMYTCLCDGEGKVIQDGTFCRWDENRFRFHLAEPSMRWLKMNAAGMDVDIKDVSEQIAAAALQGPTSRDIVKSIFGAAVDRLKFFRFTSFDFEGVSIVVSRTGYTGDLGYELWISAEPAVEFCDLLTSAESGGRFRGLAVGRGQAVRHKARRYAGPRPRAPGSGIHPPRSRLHQRRKSAHRVAKIFSVRNRPRLDGYARQG